MTEEKRQEQGIQTVVLEEQMKKSYLDYSMSVIVSRALPDVRDGLKPVHRRILYGMHLQGLTPDRPTKKSARVVGDVMAKFHPHGDIAIYDALVRMAQDFNTRYPLAQGQGNFGSIDGDGAAAMRYTEVRMSKLTQEMLRDIGKNTVDFQPNFDEEEVEPTVLPARFPNLLVNGSTGIAVGMATNMAPHNLDEVIKAICAYLDDEDISIDELRRFIKGPDFPTGAQILGTEGIKEAYETGRGRVIMRSLAEIETVKNKNRIVVTEIPYQVNKSNLIKKIAELVKDKRLEGISDIRDESGRHGIRIVIELKRDANPDVVLNNLYKNTQLQTTFGIINLALVDGVPKVLNLKELILYYVRHQLEVLTRRAQYDLDKAKKRAHIIEGLKIAIDNIDRIIAIIRSSHTDQEAKDRFHAEFSLTDLQGQAILDMQLRRLTGLQREKLDEEYKELIAQIASLEELLASPRLMRELLKSELEEIRSKYGDLRRTQIIHDKGDIDVEDMIQKEDVVITLTAFGYIKRMPEGTYKPQNRGGQGISALTTREEDFVTDLYIPSTHDTILFLTNEGRAYSKKAYEIPSTGRQAKGTAIVNLLSLGPNEKVSAVVPIREFAPDDTLLMFTKKGIVKKTSLSEYEKINRRGINAIGLHDDDELICARQVAPGQEFLLVSKKGKAIRIEEKTLRAMGRTAHGVRAMRLDEDDEIVAADIAVDEKYLLVISENGYGKMTPVSEYRVQGRGGKGIRTYKVVEKTGELISAKVIDRTDQIMMITQQGTVIRIMSEDISINGRIASGVKLMNTKDSKIVAVAKYIGE